MNSRSRFLKLLLGPVVTLFVGVLSGPLLSHIFTPEEFGRYSVLLGIVGISVVAVTVRFEQLIPASEDPHANLWVVVVFSMVGAFLLGLIGLLFLSPLEALFIAGATLAAAVFNGFYYYLIVNERVLLASAGRATQATGVIGGQVSFGASGIGLPGLIWGELAGRCVALVLVCQRLELRSIHQLRAAFSSQWPTAKWLLPGALLGALALQMLPLGMAFSVGAAAAGTFLLIYKMVVVPNSLLSKVASDTLLVELGKLTSKGASINRFVEQSVGNLLLAAICLYGSLAVYGGALFPLIMGEEWVGISQLVPWLSLLVGFWFMASPLAMVFVALNRTRWSFGLSILDVVNRCIALAIGFVYQDVVVAAAVLGIGGVFVYGISVMSAMKLANASLLRAFRMIRIYLFGVVTLLVSSWILFIHGYLWIAGMLTAIMIIIAGKKVAYV